MISFILALFKMLGLDVLPKLIEAYNKRADTLVANNKITGDVAIEMVKAQAATDNTKKELLVAEQGWWATRWIVPLLAYPVVIHWAAICIDSTFKLGWGIPAMPGVYGEAEIEIIKSFFIIGVGAATIKSVAAIIKR